ncbi:MULTISPECIES: hypothetical protein [unclassified Bradyrhizobium]|uniref:hypothetical protein n=1 Tax=unclassified Bradyrhizobium TaxID=2631580 RepID=UPI003D22A4D1
MTGLLSPASSIPGCNSALPSLALRNVDVCKLSWKAPAYHSVMQILLNPPSHTSSVEAENARNPRKVSGVDKRREGVECPDQGQPRGLHQLAGVWDKRAMSPTNRRRVGTARKDRRARRRPDRIDGTSENRSGPVSQTSLRPAGGLECAVHRHAHQPRLIRIFVRKIIYELDE